MTTTVPTAPAPATEVPARPAPRRPADLAGALPGAVPIRSVAPEVSDSVGARRFQRQAITEHFLTALEDVVWRYRALTAHGGDDGLHAEVVTAEVAHQLEVARGALHRYPALRPADVSR
jgi:hypothetical protein